jgi:acyl dehydratase
LSEAFYEDFTLGFVLRSHRPCYVTETEVIEFGARFDPRPFHVDPVAAKQSVFGGLVAPGCLVFALRSKLMNQLNPSIAYLAGLGLEKMDLPNPVRPGDSLSLAIECVELRESKSHPNAGIVHFANTLTNQDNQTVLSMLAKVMVAKRPANKAG